MTFIFAFFIIVLFQKLKLKTMLKQKPFHWFIRNGGGGQCTISLAILMFFFPFFCQQFVRKFDFWILLQVEGDGATFGSYQSCEKNIGCMKKWENVVGFSWI
jgi:hypothetical protein